MAILPFAFGGAIILLGLHLCLIAWTQLSLLGMERDSGRLCSDPEGPTAGVPLLTGHSPMLPFDPALPCSSAPAAKSFWVDKEERYYLVIEETKKGDWIDGDHRVPLAGAGSSNYGLSSLWMYAGVPLRRVFTAGWLEPIVEIRNVSIDGSAKGPTTKVGIDIKRVTPVTPPPAKSGSTDPIVTRRYIAAFIPRRFDGTVRVFLNDAMLPQSLSGSTRFYPNNNRPNNNQELDGTGLYTTRISIWPAHERERLLKLCPRDVWTAVDITRLKCRAGRRLAPEGSQGRSPRGM